MSFEEEMSTHLKENLLYQRYKKIGTNSYGNMEVIKKTAEINCNLRNSSTFLQIDVKQLMQTS